MDGYKKKLCLYNIGKINVAAVVTFFCVFCAGFLISALAVKAPYVVTGHIAGDAGLAVGLVIVGVATHEGLHALGAMLFGKVKRSEIRFGANLRQGVFYCHVEKPVTVKAYMGMLILPLCVTLVAYALVAAFGGTCLLAAVSLLIAGATGDVAMFFGIAKEKDKNRLVLDHAETTAYYLLYGQEEETDFTPLTDEEEKARIAEQMKDGGVRLGIKVALIAVFVALFALTMFVVAWVLRWI